MGGTTSFPALVGDAKMYPKDTIGQVVTDRPRTLRFSEGFTYHRCMATEERVQECDVLDEKGRKVFKILENDITVIQRAAAEAAVPMAQIEKSLVPESRRDVLNVVFFPSKNTVTPVAAVDRAVTAQPNTAAVSVATPVAITATEDTASRAPIGMSVNEAADAEDAAGQPARGSRRPTVVKEEEATLGAAIEFLVNPLLGQLSDSYGRQPFLVGFTAGTGFIHALVLLFPRNVAVNSLNRVLTAVTISSFYTSMKAAVSDLASGAALAQFEEDVFDWLVKKGGIVSETAYPYCPTARAGGGRII
eukprot:g389.t1